MIYSFHVLKETYLKAKISLYQRYSVVIIDFEHVDLIQNRKKQRSYVCINMLEKKWNKMQLQLMQQALG